MADDSILMSAKRLGMTRDELLALAMSDDAGPFMSAVDLGADERSDMTERERTQLRMLQLFMVAAIEGANHEHADHAADPTEVVIIAAQAAGQAIGCLAYQAFDQRGAGKVRKVMTEVFGRALWGILKLPPMPQDDEAGHA